jgi:hypothetical protein
MSSQDPVADLPAVLEDLFLVLTTKEKEVVVKRFALDNKSRWTLEKIGQKFSVTRERIRQIEKIALAKLRRTAPNTKLSLISDLALQILNKNGGVLTESKLVAAILSAYTGAQEEDASIVKLTLTIHPELNKVTKSDRIFPFYSLKNINKKEVEAASEAAVKTLKKREDVTKEATLLSELALKFANEDKTLTPEFILSALSTDKRIKKVEGGYGLMTWRHVNPKSIRDKAYIVLKKTEKPMHFNDIATAIVAAKFDKKSVTVQAVHNELIRYEHFVLVGRGLYALKEWGYKSGTVSEIIEDLLAKKSPLTKKDITSGVLKQRQVKKGTISLNLQKNAHFVRVGRATYSLDLSKKAA